MLAIFLSFLYDQNSIDNFKGVQMNINQIMFLLLLSIGIIIFFILLADSKQDSKKDCKQ